MQAIRRSPIFTLLRQDRRLSRLLNTRRMPFSESSRLSKQDKIPAGIGLILEKNANGELFVAGMLRGGPAERSGLIRIGDVLQSVDREIVRDLSSSDVAFLMTGYQGTPVKLKFSRIESPAQSQQKSCSEDVVLSVEAKLMRQILPAFTPSDVIGKLRENAANLAKVWREKSMFDSNVADSAHDVQKQPHKDEVPRLACPVCDMTFSCWRDCLRHLRSSRHVRHDLYPYVRDAETKQIWIDNRMEKKLNGLCRLVDGASLLDSAAKARIAPADPPQVVVKMDWVGGAHQTRPELPRDRGNPLAPHRATRLHIARRPPTIRFKRALARLSRLHARKAAAVPDSEANGGAVSRDLQVDVGDSDTSCASRAADHGGVKGGSSGGGGAATADSDATRGHGGIVTSDSRRRAGLGDSGWQ